MTVLLPQEELLNVGQLSLGRFNGTCGLVFRAIHMGCYAGNSNEDKGYRVVIVN